MVTVWYFWHGFIHRDTAFMYLQYILLPYYYLSHVIKCLESVIYHQRVHLCDVTNWPSYSIFCVVPGPSQRFFLFGEEIIIAWTHRMSAENVPESPIYGYGRVTWQQRCEFLHCHEECWSSVPPSVVVFSCVHAITISSPKWKKHCEGPFQHKRSTYSWYRAVNTD